LVAYFLLVDCAFAQDDSYQDYPLSKEDSLLAVIDSLKKSSNEQQQFIDSTGEPIEPEPIELGSVNIDSHREYILGIGIILFALLMAFGIAILSNKKNISQNQTFRLLCLIVLLTPIPFSLAAGYGKEDLSVYAALVTSLSAVVLSNNKEKQDKEKGDSAQDNN
jgi:hypothetical protein